MRKVLILQSKQEAVLYKKSPIEAEYVVCVHPSARAELQDLDTTLTSTLDLYSDEDHQATAKHITLAIEETTKHLLEAGYDDMVINRAKILVFYIISCGCFFNKIIGEYDEYIWFQGNSVKRSDFPHRAYIELTKLELNRHRLDREYKEPSSLHKFILKKYNSSLIKKIENNKKLLMTDGERATASKFIKEVQKIDDSFVCLNAKQPGKSLASSMKYISKSKKKIGKSGEVVDIFYFPEKAPKKKGILAKASKESFRQNLFDEFKFLIDSVINSSVTLAKFGENQMHSLRPHIVTNDAINTTYAEAACKTVNSIGGKTILFNHATNSPQEDELTKQVANLVASQGVIYNPHVKYNLLRSPHMAEHAKEIYGEQAEDNIFPLKHSGKIEKKSHEKFNIVFAGNYLPPKSHVPIVAETSDEFAATILELSQVVSQIPEANLIVKLKKKKKECNDEAIEKLMPKYANVTIKSSSSFASELPECDLVVANFTTTIDEALESGTPVLLYSSTYSYNHLKGMTEAPTESKRAVVYTPDRKTNLREYIEAIIKAHKNKPLEKSEYKEYIWGDQAYDMAGIAKKILSD